MAVQEEEVQNLEREVLAMKDRYSKITSDLKTMQSQIAECDGELQDLMQNQQRLEKEQSKVSLEVKKTEHKLVQLEKVVLMTG